MYNCICCHHRLLRHLNRQRAYWFCPNCHQEMPNVDTIMPKNQIKYSKIIPKNLALISNIK